MLIVWLRLVRWRFSRSRFFGEGFLGEGEGIGAGEGGFDETRLRGEVAREADSAHAAAIFGEREVRGEFVFGGGGGKVHVVIESEELFVERRVVGEDAGRVVVNLETIGDGFDDNAGAGEVGNHPMKFGSGKVGAETEITEVEFCEKGLGFGDAGALAEDPWEKFELGDVVFAVDVVVIDGVADEIETGDAKTFFVDGIIEERVVFGSSCCGGFCWVRGFRCGGFCWVGG